MPAGVDVPPPVAYIPFQLAILMVTDRWPQIAGRDVRRTRTSRPAVDPRPARVRSGLGDGAGRAVRHEPAGDLQASQGAGARRANFARSRRAAAAPPTRAQAAGGSHQMVGALPPALGRQLPAPRRPARAAQDQGEKMGTLKLTTPGEREIVMTRVFDAPRQLVFDAHTKPDLVRQWLLGPPGWSMPVCEMDVRVGGKYRWVWRHDRNGTMMGMGGVYREIVTPERLVTTEKFDEAWYPGESLNTLVLVEQGGRTTLTQTMRYESREARDADIKSKMKQGVAASYDRLADLLASTLHGSKQS